MPLSDSAVRKIIGLYGMHRPDEMIDAINLGMTVASLKGVCNGRLSIVLGDPVALQLSGEGSDRLSFVPYLGNAVALFDGTGRWDILEFSALSLAVPVVTGLYDVFAFNDAGSVAIEYSAPWASDGNMTGMDGVRSESLRSQDGIFVKEADPTRRYLGTIYSSGGVVFDYDGMDLVSYGKRHVWNVSNRVRKLVMTSDETGWYCTSDVVRPFNGDAGGVAKISIVSGIGLSYFDVEAIVYASSVDTNAQYMPGIGYDSSTTMSGAYAVTGGSGSALSGLMWGRHVMSNHIGLHTWYGLESSPGSKGITINTSLVVGYHLC